MDFQTIILKKEDHIATLILNRPERLNALNWQMTEEMIAGIEEVSRDDEMRVLIITGAGRGFCSGQDVSGLKERSEGKMTGEEFRRRFKRELNIVLGLQKLEKPTIAMVNGVCMGAGCDLAFACDIRMGSEKARFIVGYTTRGLIPGWAGTYLYPRVMGLGRALEFLFSGDALEAQEAERIGVLNKLVPADRLELETKALAQKIAEKPPIAMRLTKSQVYKGLWMDMETAAEFAITAETIAVTSEDHKEAVSSFMEKRAPRFRGR